MPSKCIERLPQVTHRTQLSRASVYRLMRLGKFPKAVKLSERAIGWYSSDIDAWIESRQSAA